MAVTSSSAAALSASGRRFVPACTSVLLALVVVFQLSGTAYSLGGYRHRNRQNPLAYYSNWGYGGPVRDESDDRRTQEDVLEALLTETEPSPGESSCFGRRCTANDKCCPGAVCVDMEEYVGTCLPTYGARKGEPCRHDDDCSPGLLCSEVSENGLSLRTCQNERHSLHRKQYSERCEISSECDLAKGLCCQLQRRHRQAPRKVCIYYKDPGNCLGSMEGAPPPPVQDIPKASPINTRLG